MREAGKDQHKDVRHASFSVRRICCPDGSDRQERTIWCGSGSTQCCEGCKHHRGWVTSITERARFLLPNLAGLRTSRLGVPPAAVAVSSCALAMLTFWVATAARSVASHTDPALQPSRSEQSPPHPHQQLITSKTVPSQSCDPSWCNCEHGVCQSVPDDQTHCNLCSQKWVFVFSAAGRTGSTSLLEGLNALPGVSLSGENFAVLTDLQSTYAKVDELVRKNTKEQDVAAYSLPNPKGVLSQTLCAQQATVAGMAGAAAGLSSIDDQIYGFKELVGAPYSDLGAAFESESPHFSMHQQVRWPVV